MTCVSRRAVSQVSHGEGATSNVDPVMLVRRGRIRREGPDAEELRLAWPGRVWEPRTGPATSLGMGGISTSEAPCGWTDGASDGASGLSACRLVHGDALDVAGVVRAQGLAGTVDLVYVDPPFASQTEYIHEARLDGPADGRVVRSPAYDDRWQGAGVAGYLNMLAPRLEALAGLLAPGGTLWVHVDYRASYLVRLLLDEVMGRGAFVNEIVWRRAPNLGRQATSNQFGRTTDTLVVYGGDRASLVPPTRLEPIPPAAVRRDAAGRPFIAAPRGDYTDQSIARLDDAGRVHRTASGKVYVKYFLVQNDEGAWCRERRVDTLWTDVPPLRHARSGERTGFPTQKPRALLDRIIACASPPGGLVVDLFSGSGTTGESAHALDRRFILGDKGAVAIATARARLLRAGVPVVLQQTQGSVSPPGPPLKVRAERIDDGLLVELVEPREPLAWAVDVRYEAPQPFLRAFHSERAPGVRSRPVTPRACIDSSLGPFGRLAVRVWNDDGGVGTTVIEAP